MARLEWDKTSERLYETGVKNCALYPWTKDAGYAEVTVDASAPSDWPTGYYGESSGTYTAVGVGATFGPTTKYYKFTEFATVAGETDVTGKYVADATGGPYTAVEGEEQKAIEGKFYANITEVPAKLAEGWNTGLYTKTGDTYSPASATWTDTTYYKKVDAYGVGVAWNGITAINETPTGAEATDLYADDMKYLSLLSAEELEGTIEAYMYPDEWEQCDGSYSAEGVTFGQQSRKQFCLAYVTTVGNDTDGNDFGEKLHLLYNGKASPSERAYATINDSPEAITFSWSLKATKEKISDELKAAVKTKFGAELKDTALITINKIGKDGKETPYYKTIYDAVYGTADSDPKILLPDDVCAIIAASNG